MMNFYVRTNLNGTSIEQKGEENDFPGTNEKIRFWTKDNKDEAIYIIY